MNHLGQILRGWQTDDDRSELDPAISQEARWLLIRRLQKLACEASRFPSQLSVTGVEWKQTENLGKGGFADVYRGTCNGDIVAVKTLRTFHMVKASDEPRVKRVRFIWAHHVSSH